MRAVKLMMMHLQANFSFFNKSKGSYSEALSVAIKIVGTLSSFVEDENENKIMTWHALRHWDENIVFGAKIES